MIIIEKVEELETYEEQKRVFKKTLIFFLLVILEIVLISLSVFLFKSKPEYTILILLFTTPIISTYAKLNAKYISKFFDEGK